MEKPKQAKTNSSDEELVEIVRSKDQERYRELVERWQAPLLRYANYLCQDEAKAADAVQEAFIRAFVNLRGFNTKRRFSSWIYRIVHNETMRLVGKHSKEKPMPEDWDQASSVDLVEDMSKEETKKIVADCLGQLPLSYREVISLFFLEEKSYEEISDILTLPTGTVGTKISRGKLLLQTICHKHKKLLPIK